MEHKELKFSPDSKLQTDFTFSIGYLSLLKVIAETSISKIIKCSTL